jgi:hypothetical protein
MMIRDDHLIASCPERYLDLHITVSRIAYGVTLLCLIILRRSISARCQSGSESVDVPVARCVKCEKKIDLPGRSRRFR